METYSNGRLKFNSDLHENHKKQWDLEDKVYVAKFHVWDGDLSLSYALKRPAYIIARMVRQMKLNGEWDFYRSLTFEQYEKIVLAKERRMKKR